MPDISDSSSLKVFHGDSHLSDGIRHFLGDVSIDLKCEFVGEFGMLFDIAPDGWVRHMCEQRFAVLVDLSPAKD